MHDKLNRYCELVRFLESVKASHFEDLQNEYERAFVEMYTKEIKALFQNIKSKIVSNHKVVRMNAFPSYKLDEFVRKHEKELSVASRASNMSTISTASTLFKLPTMQGHMATM